MTQYVGFSPWWHVAPTIITTFLEQYDLSRRAVIPVATSGSSGMGDTTIKLAPSCKGAVLKNGKCFGSDASEAELRALAEEIA